MKIAFIVPSLRQAGPILVAHELCLGLIRKGHSCKVFYFDSAVPAPMEFPCPVEHISFGRKIDFDEWDVVHSHGFRPDCYVWRHNLWRKRHCKLISTVHNMPTYDAYRVNFSRIQAFICCHYSKIAFRVFDKVVVLNPCMKEKLSGISNLKKAIVFNGRDIQIANSIANEKDQEIITGLKQKYKLVGTICSINKRKGLWQMVEALRFLPGYAFIAVGDGPELDNLKTLAKEIGVSERCMWPGRHMDATNYLSQIDLFVMCSYSEGFPLSLIEAAAYGKPTVLSNIPILQSIISPAEVGFYQIDNPRSLAETIEKTYANRAHYSKNLKNYYFEKMTVDKMAGDYMKIYSDIIAK